jgi:hydroxyacylglutathione hydrolase
MFMQRVFTEGLAQASFVVGSDTTQQAFVVDPRRDVDDYLEIASAHGLTISHVFETHIHADFASGARELAAQTGARIYLSRAGQSEFNHTPVDDGDVIEIGELRIEVLLTPGHTPEHICLLATDTSRPAAAPLLFSGDTLFAGSVGRPDLLGADQTLALAQAMYHTIHDRLIRLDDAVIVYPGHGAGSACGKQIGDDPSTTIGQEQRFNYAFQPTTEEAFVRLMLEGLPASPPYFPVMKKLNKRGPAILGDIPVPRRLDVNDLRALQAGKWGAITLLDIRPAASFGRAFLRGALNIGLGPSLPTWAGWAVRYDRPIALVVAGEADAAEAVTHLIRIGLDAVCGYAVADLSEWEDGDLHTQHIDQLDPAEARRRIDIGQLQVLDVRNPDEWDSGHIDRARHLPVGQLAHGESDGLDPERPVATVCASGFRSSLAASVLKGRGFDDVANITGGMDAWKAGGLPTTALTPQPPRPTLGEGEQKRNERAPTQAPPRPGLGEGVGG